MSRSQEIVKEQAEKLRMLWRDYGHWGFYEWDQDENDRTRELIAAYAEENNGNIFLVGDDNPQREMTYKPYDSSERIYNFSYKYITNSEETAHAICAVHNDNSYTTLFKALEELGEKHGKHFIGLMWC